MTVSPQDKDKAPDQKQTFASIAQLALIVLLGVSFLMITQRFDRQIYYYGVLLLVVSTLFQIAFGNIPAASNWKTSLIGVVIAALIIGAIVFISIQLVPTLLQLGR